MHPFWELQDVVSEVILLLSKADKARVARVNKRLWELAIPHLWRHVRDVRYFFNLFPSDLWISVKGQSVSLSFRNFEAMLTSVRLRIVKVFSPALQRELQDSDWSRFLFHSKTTKSIGYDTGSLRNIVPLEILSHSLLSTSFPSLERLSVGTGQIVEEGPVNIITRLLRPSLRYVKFHTPISDFTSPFVGPLGTIAESSSLSLEEMKLISLWDLGPFREFGSRAIASQTGLQRLTLLSMSDITSMVEGARNLPLLEELDVGTSQVYSRLPEQDLVVGFRSLTTLEVTGAPADIHNLLRSTQSDSLARVALAPNHIRGIGIYPELIAEMQRFKSHLLHLQLNLTVPSAWEDLEPALALVRLQTFGLTQRGSDPHTITDAQVCRMVDSWPYLTRFRLKSESTAGLRITLSSLAYIAFKCPNLKRLAVTFEARQRLNQEFSNRVDALPESSEKGLELLDVAGSTFDEGDEERLADEVFRLWWPKARFCQSSSVSEPSVPWEIDDAYSWPWRGNSTLDGSQRV